MERNYCKTKDVRELGSVEIKELLSVLPQLFKYWDNSTDFELNRNKSASLKEVNHITFRWSNKNKEPVEYFSLPIWDEFKSYLLPVLLAAVKPIGYNKGYFPRIMLARMQPNTVIPEHIDGHSKGWIAHKIHIPLVTNDKVDFFVKGVKYQFKKGFAYEVNNGAMHSAANNGSSSRIHLIAEYLDMSINKVPYSDF